MRKIICIFFVLFTFSLNAYSTKKKKKDSAKTETVKADRTFPKLFKDVSKLSSAKSLDLSLHLYNDKLYLEIPRRNFGREFMLTTSIIQATDLALCGIMANQPKSIIIDRKDSLVYFKKPHAVYALNQEDTTRIKAINLSKTDAICNSFRIAASNIDSSRIVIDLTNYLKTNNTDLFSLKGKSYEEGVTIQSSSPKGEEFVESINAYQNCVCVNKAISIELALGSMIGILANKPTTSLSIQMMISILPERKLMMHTEEANPHIGSGFVKYMDFRELADTKQGYYATRRRFYNGNKITFYVDTLISDSWQQAIGEAAERWNDEFEKLNLGRPLTLSPFPKDSAFSPYDPMVSSILFANNLSRYVTSRNITDPRTGEIFCTKISVPRDLAANVRRNGISLMAEVDERYRTYYLSDSLLCDVLKAYMLKAFGSSLGLAQNLAGSHAYSPQQLRSPQFTQQNGITASVMDNIIYNYIAMPGDREKGVVLTLNKPGKADAFALRYLYGNDSKKDMERIIAQHANDPEYLYGKPSMRYSMDPRCLYNDLGNNPIEAAKAKIHHLKYLVQHASSWFNMSELQPSFELFPEMSILELNSSIQTLMYHIGGIYQNEPVKGKNNLLAISVPKALQRQCVNALFELLGDITWYDSNPEFSRMGGANSNVNYFYQVQGYIIRNIFSRLRFMDLSIDHSEDPYTHKEFLTDIEHYVFSSVRKKKTPQRMDIINMGMYVSNLIGYSPTMTAIVKNKQGASNALVDEEIIPVSGVEPTTDIHFFHRTDLEPILYEKLIDAHALLLKAKGLCRNFNDAAKIQYILLTIDRVLRK